MRVTPLPPIFFPCVTNVGRGKRSALPRMCCMPRSIRRNALRLSTPYGLRVARAGRLLLVANNLGRNILSERMT